MRESIKPEIRHIKLEDMKWVETVVKDYFGSRYVVSRGVLHDALSLPGLIAEAGERRVGLVQYNFDGGDCEVVIIVSTMPRRGIGRRLLAGVVEASRAEGCRRLWLITTNDNLEAMRFFRAVGWRQVAVHVRAIHASRSLKPEIPKIGLHGIPIEDEIEFEYRIGR